MIVLLDTNIWLSELGLRSGAGSAVRFFLKQQGARIAVPEVVRLEVQHNLRSRLIEHIDRIGREYNQLLAVFGKLKEVVLPSSAEIESKAGSLFSSLDVEWFEIPFSIASARQSFEKTIKKIPPSDKHRNAIRKIKLEISKPATVA